MCSSLRPSAKPRLLPGARTAVLVMTLLVALALKHGWSRRGTVSPPHPPGLAMAPRAAAAASARPSPLLAAERRESAAISPRGDRSLAEVVDREQWSRAHPAEAVAWVLRSPSSPERQAVAELVCLQLARSNPAAALDLADALGADGYVADNLVQQWAERDLPAATAYVCTLPASVDRDRLLGRVTLVLARSDPSAAARSVAALMAPGPTQDAAALTVVQTWAGRDANAALAWIMQFPNGELRDRAYAEWHATVARTP